MNYKQLIQTMDLIGQNIGNQETKVQKKLVKIYQKLKSQLDIYEEKRNDLRLEYSSVDDKGNVQLTEKGEYVFNKDGLKKLQSDLKILLAEEVEHKPIQVVNPQGLEDHIYLKGWVEGVVFNDIDDDNDVI